QAVHRLDVRTGRDREPGASVLLAERLPADETSLRKALAQEVDEARLGRRARRRADDRESRSAVGGVGGIESRPVGEEVLPGLLCTPLQDHARTIGIVE